MFVIVTIPYCSPCNFVFRYSSLFRIAVLKLVCLLRSQLVVRDGASANLSMINILSGHKRSFGLNINHENPHAVPP